VENASNEYLDDLILSQAGHRRLKVAMLHVRVGEKCKAEGRIVSKEKFNERLRYLIDSGELESFGDISNWRFSEVQLETQTAKRKTVE
jgi:hypothetical protein